MTEPQNDADDDLEKFDVWLKEIQGIDPSILNEQELADWRSIHTDVMVKSRATPKVGLMKLRTLLGEKIYAVAIRDDQNLWLTLWVRRSAKGDVFVMIPRGDRSWDPHLSYHRDGSMHSKSFGQKMGATQKRQPLDENFKGTEHLGMSVGHGKSIGAVCNPADFAGVVEVEPGILGPRKGWVAIDLVHPDCEPMDLSFSGKVVREAIFDHAAPPLVIRVGSQNEQKNTQRAAQTSQRPGLWVPPKPK